MIGLLISLAVIVLIAVLRFGVSAEYSADGLSVSAKVGLLSVKVYPVEVSRKKAEAKAARRKKKKEEAKAKPKEKKPGAVRAMFDMLPAVKTTLGRLRRRLLIKKLTIHFTAAGSDPSKVALSFGAANAAFSAVVPILDRSFRIKKRDFQTNADFDADKQTIYINAAISLAVWEAVYIVFAMMPVFYKEFLAPKEKSRGTDRKDVNDNGQNTN